MPSSDYDAIMKALDDYEKKPATTPSAPVLAPPASTDSRQLQRPVTPAVPQTPRKKIPAPPVEVAPEIPVVGESGPEDGYTPIDMFSSNVAALQQMKTAPMETERYSLAASYLNPSAASGNPYEDVQRDKAISTLLLRRPATQQEAYDEAQRIVSKANYDADLYDRAANLAVLYKAFPGLTKEKIRELTIRAQAGLPFTEADIPQNIRGTLSPEETGRLQLEVEAALKRLAQPRLQRPDEEPSRASWQQMSAYDYGPPGFEWLAPTIQKYLK